MRLFDINMDYLNFFHFIIRLKLCICIHNFFTFQYPFVLNNFNNVLSEFFFP